MKLVGFLCLLICCGTHLSAQQNEFSYVDQKALSIPSAQTHTTNDIADYIKSNFKSDKEKLRAAYAWVTANIKYSTDSMYSINWGGDPDKKITAALRRRKGVCENYAAIFNDLALKCSIQSFVIMGYTRQSGYIMRSGHSWCAVYADNEWLLCDPTWDEGFRTNAKYFLITPDQFIETHMPFDRLWQLQNYPISQQEFNRGISRANKNTAFFNYVDSIKAFFQLSELQQLETSARRMKESGIVNDLEKNWLSYTKMKIAIFYEDDDMNLYNSAVDDLNKANSIFNSYVKYRNNQFMPQKSDGEVSSLLDPIAATISSASEKVNKIGKSKQNFQYDTGELSSRLIALTRRVQEQKDFLRRYLNSNVADRGKLFYR
ncbi:MAG: transglutaminase domain-containing protein [Ferruginibacter sp.]